MRIIAGTAKGKKIESIEGLETRPTLDRVKEAMFGSIQFELADSEVLDIFGGSGALSLEAVSRGARFAVVNDRNIACVKMIEKNVNACGFSDRFRICNEDYSVLIKKLASSGKKFDFVFIDAPYAEESGQDAMQKCFRNEIVSEGGSVILEHARGNIPSPEEGIARVVKTKDYGKCSFSVFKKV